MATLRDIRDRIGAVKNTRKITRAMKLVAGAKLARAVQAATAAKPYQETLTRVLGRVVEASGDIEHPMLAQPDNETDVIIIAMSSDRGLCGNFSSLVSRSTQTHIDELTAQGKTVRVITYGKKVRDAMKRSANSELLDSQVDLAPDDYPAAAAALADRLVRDLGADAFSQCFLSWNAYKSVMVQEPRFEQILPMKVEADAPSDAADAADSADLGASTEYLYEPSGQEILGRLLPMTLRGRILLAFLDTQAGEQAKRMTAMDAATRNASELIDTLTLDYNRARQAAITKELIEIVSGAEAL
jgi:F-type H+-transporting ATPase subunit gamma